MLRVQTDFGRKVLCAIGFTEGVFHIEGRERQTDAKLCLIEVNSRAPEVHFGSLHHFAPDTILSLLMPQFNCASLCRLKPLHALSTFCITHFTLRIRAFCGIGVTLILLDSRAPQTSQLIVLQSLGNISQRMTFTKRLILHSQ